MKLSPFICAITMSGALAFSSSVMAESFSADQKKQIEQITHEYLLNNPDVLVEVSQKLQDQQEQEMKKAEENAQKAIPKLAKALFNNNSPAIGNDKGDVTVVEFFDYQCPHCKHMGPVLDSLIKKDGNLRVVYKEFPIFGNSSEFASKAALAANMQGKYPQLHEALMNADNPLTKEKVLEAAKSVGLNMDQLSKDMDSKQVKAELEQNLKLAKELGIRGTPAFVVGSTSEGTNPKKKSFFVPGSTNEDALSGLIVEVRG